MTRSLDAFASQVRDTLQADDGPAGRERVADLLRAALRDPGFVEPLFDADAPERRIVYEDPQLGFCILAHRYADAKSSPPHDHGPSWAIYGQAEGETVMTDWARVDPGPGGTPHQVRRLHAYTLTPGLAHVYNEGDLHAPSRAGPTKLIRIEGTNLDRVTRLRYEPVTD
ncbi:MAG: hypothetical protein ABIX46_00335 [Burkholderiaceae bacterium]